MSLWRLEWLRMLRTRRLLALVGTFLFFGLLGPVVARYLADIVEGAGGTQGMVIEIPPAVPADGISQYLSNATQVGLLVAVVVAAGVLAFDAKPELAVFLRTRVGSARRLLAPRYVVMTAVTCGAFLLGTLAAWYETAVLIGPLPAGAMVAGAALMCAYLAFAVALTAMATAVVRSVLAAVAVTLVALLALPVLGLLPAVEPWLPSELLGALDQMVRGAEGADYLRALAVTLVATAGLLAGSAALLDRREI